jgi:hypothetical protein
MASVNKKFGIEKGLEVGTDALVVDADNNRTGVGKTNAQYGLDVATTANFDGIVAAGQVGVGSTQPAYDVDIRTDMRLTGRLRAQDSSAGTNGQALISVGTGVSWSDLSEIQTNAADKVNSVQYKKANLKFGGADNFVYDPTNQRVGIGSTQPEYLLQVQRQGQNGYVQIGGTFLDANAQTAGIGSVLGATDGDLTWVGAGASTLNVIYVSEDGLDTNDGRRASTAKRTVKAAAAIAVNGDVIRVSGGIYPEQNPISLPQNVSVDGDDLRNTKIIPQNTGADLFHVDNGCLIQNCSFVGAANTGAMVAYHPPREVLNRFNKDAGVHTFVSGVTNAITASAGASGSFTAASGTTYNPTTGFLILEIGSHSLTTSNKVTIADNGVTFTCDLDNHVSEKSYPRATDPASGVALTIDAVSGTTITVNIGKVKSAEAVHVSSWNGATLGVTEFDYSSKSGVATVTVGTNHGLTAGVTQIGFRTESIGLKCSTDNFNKAKYYPRVGTDPYVGTLISIASTTATTFTANIGVAGIGSEYVGFITQSPYVRNCTNFVPDSIGMQINGERARGLKSMVVDSYTQYNENGIGVSITNNGYGQLVSIFTICPNIGIYCGSGGQCDLTNSNSSFGNKGLVAQGIGTVGYSAQLASNAIAEDNTFVLSGLGTFRPYSGQVLYVGELFQDVDSVTVTNAGSGYTSAQPPVVTISNPSGPGGIAADGVAVISGFGSVTGVNLIANGRQYRSSDTVSVTIAPPTSGVTATASATLAPAYYTINSATTPSGGISTVTVDQTIPAAIGIGSTVPIARQSLILASSHSFEYIGTGVTIAQARPSQGGVTIPENQVISLEGGKVVHTSTDERGNFLIGDDFIINQQTGTIAGDSFNKSIQATLTPLIIALGGQ